jgi:UDP-N-acetylmuramoyl-tripeptide--D-alanyl-D-alanine ligase
VVAITGSWGKTSTKNHLADLVGAAYQTVASPASWNNMAGLARTVNENLVTGTEILVLEMGTYGPGEIASMCAWTRPEISVICEIGPMHLERMKTMDTIVDAKAEIAGPADQVVLWVENPYLERLAQRLGSGHKLWRVGRAGRPGLDVAVQETGDELEFFWGETLVGAAPLRGRVQPGNVACAVAAALALGLSPDRIGAQLSGLSVPPHRAVASRTEGGLWVIDDTYNSNPAGAAAALDRLFGSGSAGRRVVITPGMVELGSEQAGANRAFAASAAARGAELVVVGRTNRRDLLAGFGPGAVTVADREAARKWVAANLQPGDAVLWENDLPPHYP